MSDLTLADIHEELLAYMTQEEADELLRMCLRAVGTKRLTWRQQRMRELASERLFPVLVELGYAVNRRLKRALRVLLIRECIADFHQRSKREYAQVSDAPTRFHREYHAQRGAHWQRRCDEMRKLLRRHLCG